MSETEILPPPPEPIPEPITATPPPESLPPPRRRRPVWPVLGVLGFLILAAGEGYLWRLYQTIPHNADRATAARSQLAGQVAALQSQVAALQQIKPQLPPPQPVPAQQAQPNDIAVQADLAQKLAAVTAQVNAMQTQLGSDHGALTQLQSNAVDLTKLSAKITLLNRLDAARMALEAGQPLGDLPGAPPALAKFATTPPPTQAGLLLAFPAAARAAEAASVAGNGNGTYWSAVRARLENLITISNGDRVIVGAPAAGVIAQARETLNAGDLAGALAKLDTLSPPVQAAMGNWLGQARDLLAARAAIITLSDQA